MSAYLTDKQLQEYINEIYQLRNEFALLAEQVRNEGMSDANQTKLHLLRNKFFHLKAIIGAEQLDKKQSKQQFLSHHLQAIKMVNRLQMDIVRLIDRLILRELELELFQEELEKLLKQMLQEAEALQANYAHSGIRPRGPSPLPPSNNNESNE